MSNLIKSFQLDLKDLALNLVPNLSDNTRKISNHILDDTKDSGQYIWSVNQTKRYVDTKTGTVFRSEFRVVPTTIASGKIYNDLLGYYYNSETKIGYVEVYLNGQKLISESSSTTLYWDYRCYDPGVVSNKISKTIIFNCSLNAGDILEFREFIPGPIISTGSDVLNLLKTLDVPGDFHGISGLNVDQVDFCDVNDESPAANNVLWSSLKVNNQLKNLVSEGVSTSDDLYYRGILEGSSYGKCYYDKFEENNLISNGTYWDDTSFGYSFFSNSSARTKIITLDKKYYKFMLVLDGSGVFKTNLVNYYYSKDNVTYIKINPEEDVFVLNGFTSLYFKFECPFGYEGNLHSFAFLYADVENGKIPKRRMYEKIVLNNNVSVSANISLPNNASYTPNTNSLDFYLNGIRMTSNVDYKELDKFTIQILMALEIGDILEFTEEYGFIDTSSENKGRLDVEHNEDGYHILEDIAVSGSFYKIVVSNGAISATPYIP